MHKAIDDFMVYTSQSSYHKHFGKAGGRIPNSFKCPMSFALYLIYPHPAYSSPEFSKSLRNNESASLAPPSFE
jgi:hypothetical protein